MTRSSWLGDEMFVQHMGPVARHVECDVYELSNPRQAREEEKGVEF